MPFIIPVSPEPASKVASIHSTYRSSWSFEVENMRYRFGSIVITPAEVEGDAPRISAGYDFVRLFGEPNLNSSGSVADAIVNEILNGIKSQLQAAFMSH